MNKILSQWIGETREDRIMLEMGYLGALILTNFLWWKTIL